MATRQEVESALEAAEAAGDMETVMELAKYHADTFGSGASPEPDEYDPENIQYDEYISAGDHALGAAQNLASVPVNLAANVSAGLMGIGTALNPFTDANAADTVRHWQDKLSYTPQSKGAQAQQQSIAKALAPVSELEQGLGNYALEKTGSPLLATGAHMLPELTATMLGGLGGSASKARAVRTAPDKLVKQRAKAKIGEEIQKVHNLETETGVPVRTQDIINRRELPVIGNAIDQFEGFNPVSKYKANKQTALRQQKMKNLEADLDVNAMTSIERIMDGTPFQSADAVHGLLNSDAYKTVYNRIKDDPIKVKHARSNVLQTALKDIDPKNLGGKARAIRDTIKSKKGMFTEEQFKAADSLARVMFNTRRTAKEGFTAQEALIPLLTILAPVTGGTGLGLGVAFESKAFRNAIIKLGMKKKITADTKELIDATAEAQRIADKIGHKRTATGSALGAQTGTGDNE